MDSRVRRYIESHLEQALQDLERFCAQPSVSAQGLGLRECASLVARMLRDAGVGARVMPVRGGPPAVYGEVRGDSPRTVLFYDHYDVQPPEPLELWETPPFQPSRRNGHLYARGVSDDKGNFVARLWAVRAWLETRGRPPCGVKFFLEGEEEVGSPHLGPFVEAHRDLLRADGCIWEGGGVNFQGRPVVYLGLKGILYVELEARGPNRDVHSSLGGVVPNPAWRLAWALSSIKGPDERILIKGFYDDVRSPTPEELEALRQMPDESPQMKRDLGLRRFLGDARGLEFRRRHLLEPSCSICGLVAGYTGPGSKTIVPAVARAKLDFRLVPDQRPPDILEKLKAHLREQGFGDIRVIHHGAGPWTYPARTPITHPWVGLVREAARDALGADPVVVPTMAGSGPMHCFTGLLGLPVATAGVGHPANRIHAPNENIRVEDFLKGMLHAAALLEVVGSW